MYNIKMGIISFMTGVPALFYPEVAHFIVLAYFVLSFIIDLPIGAYIGWRLKRMNSKRLLDGLVGKSIQSIVFMSVTIFGLSLARTTGNAWFNLVGYTVFGFGCLGQIKSILENLIIIQADCENCNSMNKTILRIVSFLFNSKDGLADELIKKIKNHTIQSPKEIQFKSKE